MEKETKKYIFRKTIRTRDGRILYASNYGLKAFKIAV